MLPLDSTSALTARAGLGNRLAADPASLKSLGAVVRRNDAAALDTAARAFESLLVGQMLKQMRTASLGEGILDSQHSRMYQEMHDQQIAANLSDGRGLGIRQALLRQLSPSGPAVSAESGAERTLAVPERTPWLRRLHPAESSTDAAPTARSEEAASGATSTGIARAGEGRWPPRNPQEFLDYLAPHAEQAAARLGVDPHVLLAQSALETGWGKHVPRHADGSSSFNLFGIKANRAWQGERVSVGTLEYRDGVARREQARFRAYPSPAGSFEDYVDFLQRNPRYGDALAHADSPRDFVRGLQRAGYATDPRYAEKILGIHAKLRRMSAEQATEAPAAPQVSTAPADKTRVRG
ncbi:MULTISPECIES: flagellar assembly peptidoglycan hydrolase FlgJ [Marichromatium]|uniref:Peptidoglycan hydrolase FlgJ n=1 Tax=Marichromatium gracile TaxID=1048 RepID=A0A4R4AAG6_MARGR|nr:MULTISPECIES: flagellar assembly peptidoglycan hydrolase FlgJ [Marichromatium]MBK1708154.1 flagellar assembly peptidoglycan hydrolase FlgJ [Marichromatium gracile]RNE89610.1 flagellar assembly peptidoglycan hydrolase FlgJ [Marichromatium sp. AB31]RNE94689.1 flagellar assembly peptidoglycan hydrolase FlgJ [Marichromatium sp. AB32]TCW35835.1 flagellar protein FlgJ [Marichromatium gracile]